LKVKGLWPFETWGKLLAPQRGLTSWKIFIFVNTAVRTTFIVKLSSVIGGIYVLMMS
jgi:hypothetical protein